MALIEEFDKSGNWLFRWRSFLPLALYAMAVAVILLTETTDVPHDSFSWSMICLGISLFGQLIRAITVGFTPKSTSGRNTKAGQVAEVLNTKGIYSTVRHPLYVGNFFMWIGIVIYVGSWWFSAFTVLLFWLYYERIMFAEEFFLRKKFGHTYLNWAEKTPAFIPKLSKWSNASMSFSLKNVLKREYNGFFAVFISFILLNVLKNYLLYKTLSLEFLVNPWWIWLTLGSFVIFITLRTLKKKTSLLKVEGRW
ncbi:MAG: protein-S-isoprenylcysteine O-methyltransferase Ste14 [Saprospiraceae bacterium]|jgi:protein-S-isoprenylcysteine O-methyltransferase Ste14